MVLLTICQCNAADDENMMKSKITHKSEKSASSLSVYSNAEVFDSDGACLTVCWPDEVPCPYGYVSKSS
jgi:hypothetical protein